MTHNKGTRLQDMPSEDDDVEMDKKDADTRMRDPWAED